MQKFSATILVMLLLLATNALADGVETTATMAGPKVTFWTNPASDEYEALGEVEKISFAGTNAGAQKAPTRIRFRATVSCKAELAYGVWKKDDGFEQEKILFSHDIEAGRVYEFTAPIFRSTEDSNASSETAFFDEGDKLSVKVTHTAPAGFPETLFEAADNYIKEYIPDETAAAKIRESETDSLRISCDIRGYYIGAYRCVTMNAAIKKSADVPITSSRSYVYDEAGTEVEIGSCFAEDFDINTYVSGILAASVNGLMEDGWTIEEEVDITDIDFFLESDSVTFSTLPARMSRKVTAADGTEQDDTRKDSITAKASFDEIGAANLTVAAQ